MTTNESRVCKHCRAKLEKEQIHVQGPNVWCCGFCKKPTTEKGHKLLGRGPWCPACQYEFNQGELKDEAWQAACAGAAGGFEVKCGECDKNVVPVWSFDVIASGPPAVAPASDVKALPSAETEQSSQKTDDEKAARHGDDRRGYMRITSSMNKLDPEVMVKEIEIEMFATSNALVSWSMEAVLKDQGGYPVGKVSCFVSWPCYREEVTEAIEVVKGVVRKNVAKTVADAIAKAKQKQAM